MQKRRGKINDMLDGLDLTMPSAVNVNVGDGFDCCLKLFFDELELKNLS